MNKETGNDKKNIIIFKMKYTDENINNALRKLGLIYETDPKLVVKSKLVNGDNSWSFIYKKYPLYNVPILPSHEYVIINGYSFHPGAKDEPILIEDDDSVGITTLIEEKCSICAKSFLMELFKRDANFNIMMNNCQMIMGNLLITPLIWLGIVFLWSFVIYPSLLLLFIGCFSIFFALIYDKLNDWKTVIEYKTCPHILKF